MRGLFVASLFVAISSTAISGKGYAAAAVHVAGGKEDGSIASPLLASSTFAAEQAGGDDSRDHWESEQTADPCALIPSSQRCLKVRKCSDDPSAPITTINGYWLTNTAEGTYKTPSQHTNVTICYHENKGLQISEFAADRHAFTPYTSCNSYVWQRSSALELMIFPVKTAFDVPRFYYEIDLTPSGATYGAMIFNNKGNATNCATCKAEELKCSGANIFPQVKDMKLAARYLYDTKTGEKVGWSTTRFLPFNMFYELQGKSKMFRFNFFRYGYPNGANGAYELSGYSPTWNPSFHIPSRFALMALV